MLDMDQFVDVTSLRELSDEGESIDAVFERFPKDTPAEVMALAEREDGSPSRIDSIVIETFLEDISPPQGIDSNGDSSNDGEPFDVTADELFTD
ncbi:MAG: hypothetical protein ACI9EZ_001247 [Halobacteriales archaeon]|jgi:hypothetical protein